MVREQSTISVEDGCLIRVVHQKRVAEAGRDALADEELSRLSLLMKALADPTRLKMVRALTGGEMCVCDLAAHVGLSESAISHQLRRLRERHLVRTRRQGPILYYSLDDDHVADLLRVGLEHVREG